MVDRVKPVWCLEVLVVREEVPTTGKTPKERNRARQVRRTFLTKVVSAKSLSSQATASTETPTPSTDLRHKVVQVVLDRSATIHKYKKRKKDETHNDDDDDDSEKPTTHSHDADHQQGITPWFELKGARKLLRSRAKLKVWGLCESNSNDDESTTSIRSFQATKILLIRPVLEAAYVSSLLLLPRSAIRRLFPEADDENDDDFRAAPNDQEEGPLPESFVRCLMPANAVSTEDGGSDTIPGSRPSDTDAPPSPPPSISSMTAIIHDLFHFAHAEREAGRGGNLYRSDGIVQHTQRLIDGIRTKGLRGGPNGRIRHRHTGEIDDETRGRYQRIPPTRQNAWEALERLQALYGKDSSLSEEDLETLKKDDAYTRAQQLRQVVYDDHISSNDSDSGAIQLVHGPSRPVTSPTTPQASEHDTSAPALPLDPRLNLPDPTDERRVRYVEQHKQPQIKWMVQRILALLEGLQSLQDPKQSKVFHLVDVGGGRGDLAHALAALCGPTTANDSLARKLNPQNLQVSITVLDNNESSLKAGQERAASAGLTNVSFILYDLSHAMSNQEPPRADIVTTPSSELSVTNVDLVYGLHCCGGLAEAAVELALLHHAPFVVSTCCFRSNLHLATLSQRAVCGSITEPAEEIKASKQADSYRAVVSTEDYRLVSRLAVRAGAKGQHWAIRVLNDLRLSQAKQRAKESQKNLEVWQEAFPVQLSIQNRVLFGQFQSKMVSTES